VRPAEGQWGSLFAEESGEMRGVRETLKKSGVLPFSSLGIVGGDSVERSKKDGELAAGKGEATRRSRHFFCIGKKNRAADSSYSDSSVGLGDEGRGVF